MSGEEAAVAQSPAPKVPERRLGRPAVRLAVVGVVIVLAVGFLLVKGLGSSLDYFKTVDEAIAQRSAIGTGQFRLEGVVKAGSVERTTKGAAFTLEGKKGEIAVVNRGTPPQLFKAGMPVIVVGHFPSRQSVVFSSDQIMVKHSSNYVEQHPDRVKANDGSVN